MAESDERVVRTLEVLDGGYVSPLVAGLSLVPADVLPGSQDPATRLVRTCIDLDLDFAFVPGIEDWAEDAAEALAAEGRAVFWVVDGPLWRTFRRVGLANGLAATAREPETLRAPLQDETERMLSDIGAAPTEHLTGIVVADDLAGSSGMLVSPDFAIAEIVPRIERAVDVARSEGLPVVLHSDGDVRVILEGLAKAGVRGVHGGGGLGPEAFERLFAGAHSRGLSFIGGIDTAHIDRGVPSAINAGMRAGFLAQAGGLLLSDDGGLSNAEQFPPLVSALAAARDVGAPA